MVALASAGIVRRLSNTDYPIFIRTQGLDGQPSFHSIELSSDRNLVDLIHTIRCVIEIPGRLSLEEVVVTVNGKEYRELGGSSSNITLADAGVGAESVVDVAWPLLAGLTDIELLFHLFDDPRHTKAAIGYARYSDFAIAYPQRESQKQRLQGRLGIFQPYLMAQFTDRLRVRYITVWSLRGDIGKSTINFEAVQRMEFMEILSIVDSHTEGTVYFDKLPRNLIGLHLSRNHFTEIRNPEQCPSGLTRLLLDENEFEYPVSRELFPNTIVFDSFDS